MQRRTWRFAPEKGVRDPLAKGDSCWKSSVLGLSNAVCGKRQGVVISVINQWNNTLWIGELWTTVNHMLIHNDHIIMDLGISSIPCIKWHTHFLNPLKRRLQKYQRNLTGSWDWRHKSCRTWRLASYEWLWHLCPLVKPPDLDTDLCNSRKAHTLGFLQRSLQVVIFWVPVA